jgi:hypothetical protein
MVAYAVANDEGPSIGRCLECAEWVSGGSCPTHPEALVIPAGDDVPTPDIMHGVPGINEWDGLEVELEKRLILTRCALDSLESWAARNAMPSIAAVVAEQKATLLELHRHINPESALLIAEAAANAETPGDFRPS